MPWQSFPIQVGGGLIKNRPPIQQGIELPGSANRLVNFEPSIRGGYRRVNGYSKFSSTAVTGGGQIWGVCYYEGVVIAARGSNVYTSTGGSWTSIQGSRTQTTKQRFHQFNFDGNKKVVVTDGSNYPYTWDGTTFTNINGTADVLACDHAISFKDHMFYAAGNLVTFTVPFDEADFTVADGAGNFRMPGDVTGMIVFRERLFIFTEREIKVLDGDSVTDWRLTDVTDDVGCVEPDTIQEVGADVMFLAKDGLRLLGATDRIGDFSLALVGKEIQEDVNELKDLYTSFSSVVVRDKSQYRLLGFLSGRDDLITEGVIGAQLSKSMNPDNPQGFEWAFSEGFAAYSAYSIVYGNEEFIVFCNEDDYVYRMESGSDFDGTAIPSSFWTPWLSFDDPVLRKTIYTVTMFVQPEGTMTGRLTLNFDLDSGSKIQPMAQDFSAEGTATAWDAENWDSFVWAEETTGTIREQVVGSGNNVSLRFNFTADQDPFIIDTIVIEYGLDDRR